MLYRLRFFRVISVVITCSAMGALIWYSYETMDVASTPDTGQKTKQEGSFHTQSVTTPPLFHPLNPTQYVCGQCQTDSDCGDPSLGCFGSVCVFYDVGTVSCTDNTDCFGGGNYSISNNEIIKISTNSAKIANGTTSFPYTCRQNQCRFRTPSGGIGLIGLQSGTPFPPCACGNGVLENQIGEQCELGTANCSSSCQCEPGYEPDPNGNGCVAIQTIACPNASEIVTQLVQGEPGCPGELLATVDEIAGFTAGRYDSNGNTLSEGWSIDMDAPGTYTMHFQLQNTNVSPTLICDYYPTVHINPDDFIMDSMCSVCGDGIENETEECDGGANCTPSCECPVGYESDPNSNGCSIKPFTPPVFSPLDPTTYVCGQCQSNTDCEAGETCRSSLCIPDLSAPCSNDNACYGGPVEPNQLIRARQTNKITNTTISNSTSMVCNKPSRNSQGQCALQGYLGNQGRNVGGDIAVCHCGNGIVEQGTNEQCDGTANCTTSCQCAPGYTLNESGNGCTLIENNDPPVTYARETGDRSSCSAICGGGIQSRNVQCKDSNGLEVSDSFCAQPKPATTQACNTQLCPTQTVPVPEEIYQRETGNRSLCSAQCGGGTQIRNVICTNSSGTPVSDGLCSGTKPPTTQPCNIQLCPDIVIEEDPEPITYTRHHGTFGQCTKECGGGIQTRRVECRDQNGLMVAESFCPAITKPTSSQACNTQACPTQTDQEPTKTYSRYHGTFGQCTKECGGGTQTRRVECRDEDGLMVAESFCPTITKPTTSQPCNTQACIDVVKTKQGEWMIGLFGPCDKQCGGGIQTRTVQCKDEDGKLLSDSQCPTPKPTTQQSCNTKPCATTTTNTIETYKRKEGERGKCTKACGGGEQTRSVVCTDSNGNTVSDDLCPGNKPITKQKCNTQACIINGACDIEFGLCAAGTLGNANFYSCGNPSTWTCFGQGTGAKHASCVIENDPCDNDSLLNYRRKATQIGGCSELCEGGIQQREVICIDDKGKKVDERFCKHLPKPPVETECNQQRCTKFTRKTDAWGACSETCGGGGQTRLVTCVNERGNTVAESFCTETEKPATKQSCNTHPCAEDVDPTLSCGPKYKHTFMLSELKTTMLLVDQFDFCLNIPNGTVLSSSNNNPDGYKERDFEINKQGVFTRQCPYVHEGVTIMTPCEAYVKSTTCGYADEQQYKYFFNGSKKYPDAFCADEGAEVIYYEKTETGRSRGCKVLGLKTTMCEAYREDLICEEKVTCECTIAYTTPPQVPQTTNTQTVLGTVKTP